MRISRGIKVAISGVLILCFIAVALPAFAQEGSVVEKMGKKLGRGLVNVATGWIELPKNIYDTSVETNNPLMGITYGLIKGVGMTVVRTGAGAYEIATFLFPIPEDYQPLIEPEFVFEEK